MNRVSKLARAKRLSAEAWEEEEQKRRGHRFETLEKQAIAARGGGCLSCGHCNSIVAVKPVRAPAQLKAIHLPLRVDCGLDKTRKSPFQKSPGYEHCPTLMRHSKRQNKTAE